MADIVDPKTRSRMMSGIRGKNTRPEVLIRKRLHTRGFRFRLHVKSLPGKPDLVLPKYHAVIFTHGCFWHRHDCRLFKWPSTRPDFWKAKINRNCENDVLTVQKLRAMGWRICVIWECSIKGANKDLEGVADRVANWLRSDSEALEIRE